MIRAWLALAVLLAGLVVLGSGLPSVAAPGDLDPSLATTGQVVTDVTRHFGQAAGVALQLDGGVVLVGSAAPTGPGEASDLVMARYGADGALDESFGAGGTVITDLFGDADRRTRWRCSRMGGSWSPVRRRAAGRPLTWCWPGTTWTVRWVVVGGDVATGPSRRRAAGSASSPSPAPQGPPRPRTGRPAAAARPPAAAGGPGPRRAR